MLSVLSKKLYNFFALMILISNANQSFAQDVLYVLWQNADGNKKLTAYKIIKRSNNFITGESSALDLFQWKFAKENCQIVKVESIIVDNGRTFFEFDPKGYQFSFTGDINFLNALIVNDFEVINKLSALVKDLKDEVKNLKSEIEVIQICDDIIAEFSSVEQSAGT